MRAEPQDCSRVALATDILISASGLRCMYKFLKNGTT